MTNCKLCPNGCDINKSFCGRNEGVKIAKYYLHPFEEPCLTGKNGSGTIFFCGCSLKCVFCQNYELSRNQRGKVISIEDLSRIFKNLEDLGASNINLVNPTHFSEEIVEALKIYKPKIPIVYNTHSYEKIEILEKIDKYVDIYLADMKYCSPNVALRYCGKKNYFDIASKAIEFMSNKPLYFNQDGQMNSGLIVRHLVLPQNTFDSKAIINWFATIKDKAYLNVMSQYTPYGDLTNTPELKRPITKREYKVVLDYAMSLDIEKMFYQKQESANTAYIPKWDY